MAADGTTAPGLTGIVLAGGASRRMGRDKAALSLPDGPTLARRAADRLAAVRPEITEVAVADRGRGLIPGLPSLPDGPGAGPAAGLLGAARAYPGRPLLALACDLPGVPAALLAALAAFQGDCDWAAPRLAPGRAEPLCALYSPAALAVLERRVAGGRLDLQGLAEEELRVRWLESEELAAFGRVEEVFFNLNTPEDLARWLEQVRGRP